MKPPGGSPAPPLTRGLPATLTHPHADEVPPAHSSLTGFLSSRPDHDPGCRQTGTLHLQGQEAARGRPRGPRAAAEPPWSPPASLTTSPSASSSAAPKAPAAPSAPAEASSASAAPAAPAAVTEAPSAAEAAPAGAETCGGNRNGNQGNEACDATPTPHYPTQERNGGTRAQRGVHRCPSAGQIKPGIF